MNNDLQKRLAEHRRGIEVANIIKINSPILEILNRSEVEYTIYYHGFPELNHEHKDICPLNVKLSSSNVLCTSAGYVSWDSNLHSTVEIEENSVCEALSRIVMSYLEDPQCVEVASNDLRFQVTISWESLLLMYQQLRQQILSPILLIDNRLFIEDDGNYFRVMGNIF